MKFSKTKITTFLVNGFIIIIFALLMGGIGLIVARFMFLDLDYEIPWDHYILQNSPKEIVSIVNLEVHSTIDDPTGDTINIETKDGAIYSNTLFESKWLLVEPVPNWEPDHISKCAPEWPGAHSDAPIWEPPPVKKNILDSAGVRFERPFSIIVRCYVLSCDGNIEVWVS